MICSKCGQQVPDNVAFCRNCGTPTGVNAADAANAAKQAAQQAAQAAAPQPGMAPQPGTAPQPGMPAPVQPAVVRSGVEIGVPGDGTITNILLNFMGPDHVKSAKLLWRIFAGVGAFFILLHTIGLWFGKALKVSVESFYSDYSLKYSFGKFCKNAEISESGITVITLILLILLTIGIIGMVALAVMKFLNNDVSDTFKFISFAFMGIAGGKLWLCIWNFILRTDVYESDSIDVDLPFFLIFSLLVCVAFAALFFLLSKEFSRYKEPVAARPVMAQQPYPQAPQQPFAQAPQQPYAQAPQQPYPQAPQQPYPQAPQQPQNPQNPYQQ